MNFKGAGRFSFSCFNCFFEGASFCFLYVYYLLLISYIL